MTQPNILNRVKYRLQSVDYGTFLERRDRTLLLRPLKTESEQQQWIFVQPKSNTKVYEIRNVDDEGQVLLGRLVSGNTYALSVAKSAKKQVGRKWKFYYDAPQKTDSLYMVSSDLNDDENIIAFVQNYNTPSLEHDPNLPMNFNKVNKDEEYRWRLVEVSPASLPEGHDSDVKYRIRTFNGQVIHSLPGQATLSTKDQNRGDHRAWKIKDMGNGVCTLLNVKENKFLGVERDRVNDRWLPVLTEDTVGQDWFIEATSGHTWSICIWRDVSHNGVIGRELLSLSLSDDTVILKQWKAAHNQIWMLEVTTAPTHIGGGGGQGGSGDQDGVGPNKEILPGSDVINNRDYRLFNNNGTFGIVVEVNGSTGIYRFLVTKQGGSPSPHDLTVDARPGGKTGEVCIYYEYQGNAYYLTLSGTSVLAKTGTPYYWIIEQDPASQLFLIRDSKSQLVVSAPATQNASIITKQYNIDATTLWAFESDDS